MTPREPDRYEAKAREVTLACRHVGTAEVCNSCVAAALRAVESETLERAAHRLEEIARDYEGRKLRSLAMDETVEATFLEQMARAAWRCVKAIYEMKSPAAAPAAEKVRCMCPPGAVAGSCPLRNDVQSICECRCHAAPPPEPAAPSPDLRKECGDNSPVWWSGRWRDWHRGHGCGKDDGKPCTSEGAAEFAAHGRLPGRVTSAPVQRAEKRCAELERVIDLSYPFVAEGDENTTVDGLTQEQIVRHINKVMRAATPSTPGDGSAET